MFDLLRALISEGSIRLSEHRYDKKGLRACS